MKTVKKGITTLVLSATLMGTFAPFALAAEAKPAILPKYEDQLKEVQVNMVGYVKLNKETSELIFYSEGKPFTLKGKTTGLEKYQNLTVRIKGKLFPYSTTGRSVIVVESYEVLQKAPINQTITVEGKFIVRGNQYFLQTHDKTYQLSDNISKIKQSNGAIIRVVGKLVNNHYLQVDRYTFVKEPVPVYQGLVGEVVVNSNSTFLSVNGKKYLLAGNLGNLPAMHGAVVKVVGSEPYYIQRPDIPTFLVRSYEVIKPPVQVVKELTGEITVKEKSVFLSTNGKKYLLTGNLGNLPAMHGAVVKVVGSEPTYIKQPEIPTFVVRSYQVIKPPVQNTLTVNGLLVYTSLEGGAYILQSEQGKFLLLGNQELFKKFVGQPVKVKGTLKDVLTPQMIGKPLQVDSIEPLAVFEAK